MQKLVWAYERRWPGQAITSVALGDGPNDIGMLSAADIAVVIPGRHEHPMELTAMNRILKPSAAGPVGWNTAVLAILSDHPE